MANPPRSLSDAVRQYARENPDDMFDPPAGEPGAYSQRWEAATDDRLNHPVQRPGPFWDLASGPDRVVVSVVNRHGDRQTWTRIIDDMGPVSYRTIYQATVEALENSCNSLRLRVDIGHLRRIVDSVACVPAIDQMRHMARDATERMNEHERREHIANGYTRRLRNDDEPFWGCTLDFDFHWDRCSGQGPPMRRSWHDEMNAADVTIVTGTITAEQIAASTITAADLMGTPVGDGSEIDPIGVFKMETAERPTLHHPTRNRKRALK